MMDSHHGEQKVFLGRPSIRVEKSFLPPTCGALRSFVVALFSFFPFWIWSSKDDRLILFNQ